MPKDHAGGPVPPGLHRVPVEWSEDVAFAVAIVDFNFDCLDNVEDRLREELGSGRPIGPWLEKLTRSLMELEREEIVAKVLGLIVGSRKPGLAADQLACAAGLHLTAETPWTDLARKHGVSKQAFEQGVERFCVELRLRKTRTMRDAAARESMRASNYRPHPRPKKVKKS